MKITYKQIISFDPCYDPVNIGMTQDYEDTIVNFIKEYRHKVREQNDIFWVLLRNEFLSDKELRLFAVWCVRQVQHLITDKRILRALAVAEAYAKGDATKEKLEEARSAAGGVSSRWRWDWADVTAGRSAIAAFHATRDEALYAARYAAIAAARTAGEARSAAVAAATSAQIDNLLEIFESGNNPLDDQSWFEFQLQMVIFEMDIKAEAKKNTVVFYKKKDDSPTQTIEMLYKHDTMGVRDWCRRMGVIYIDHYYRAK